MLKRFVDDEFSADFHATVGIDFCEKIVDFQPEMNENNNRENSGTDTTNNKADLLGSKPRTVFLQLWDTAGQERFRSLTTAFYRDAMGFLLVFDLTNPRTFHNVRNWALQLRTHAYCEAPDIVLCGNKADIKHRAVSDADARGLAEELGFPYVETSAADGTGIEEAYHKLLQLVMERIYSMEAVEAERIKELASKEVVASKSGCQC